MFLIDFIHLQPLFKVHPNAILLDVFPFGYLKKCVSTLSKH